MGSSKKLVKHDKTSADSYDFDYVYAAIIAIAIVLRNSLMPSLMIPRYGKFPMKFNPTLVRTSSAYSKCLASGKEKSFHRNLYFNMMRVVSPLTIK